MLRMWHFLNAFKETHTILKAVSRKNCLKVLQEASQLLRAAASEQFFFYLRDTELHFCFLPSVKKSHSIITGNQLGWLRLAEKMKLTTSKSKRLSKIIFSHHCRTKTLPNVNMDCIVRSLGTSWQAWLTHVEQSKRIFPSLLNCFSILLMVTTLQQRAETMFQTAWQIIVRNSQFVIYLYCVWLVFFLNGNLWERDRIGRRGR